MQSFRYLLRQKSVYFISFIAALVIAIVLVSLNTKIGCFLELNSIHHPVLDSLFVNLTFLGDGLFSLIIALLLLIVWKQRRLSLHIVTAFVLSGIAAQVLKHLYNAPRPKEIIQSMVFNSFIHGKAAAGWDSFPSGHTTSAFALATILALHANKKGWGLFFLLTAVGVGYSRIYLGNHFLEDVMAGAVLGTVVGVLVYRFVNIRKGYFSRNGASPNTLGENKYTSTLAGK